MHWRHAGLRAARPSGSGSHAQARMSLTIVEILTEVAARMRSALSDVLGDNEVLSRHARICRMAPLGRPH
jgi:hypothetical protein